MTLKCPACLQQTLFSPLHGQRVRQCRSCDHLCRTADYIEEFDYAWYEKNSYWYNDPQWHRQQAAFAAIFRDTLTSFPTRPRVVEFGAAGGEFLDEVAFYNSGDCDLVYSDLVDVRPDGVAVNAVARLGSFEQVSVQMVDAFERFDCVVMIDVIEHIKDPFKALVTVHKLLKKRGKFIMVTGDGEKLDGIDEMFRHEEHFHVWSPSSWRETVKQANKLLAPDNGFAIKMFWQDPYKLMYAVLEKV